MSSTPDPLPLTDTLSPATQDELADAVQRAYLDAVPLYPIGGGTSLDFGRVPKRKGWGLSLSGMSRIVDYPARDMTVTVEAGLAWSTLTETLAKERQRLPVDVPQPDRATVGGVVATNTSGPRRFGHGTIRDYVIGISAVDGRGTAFKGGGRVVKNVAGYDFCKLLVGSLGTLGVVSQVTFKIKPVPESSAFVVTELKDLQQADGLLTPLITKSAVTPSCLELLTGPVWQKDGAMGETSSSNALRLVIGLEGTTAEVEWMKDELRRELNSTGVGSRVIDGTDDVAELWSRLVEFPAERGSPLVIKAQLVSSAVPGFIQLVQQIDAKASIQSHAGNGTVIVRFADFPVNDISKVLVGKLQTAARNAQGSVVVLSYEGGGELTSQLVWGGAPAGARLMTAIKQQFDPKGLLNPGRFIYDDT